MDRRFVGSLTEALVVGVLGISEKRCQTYDVTVGCSFPDSVGTTCADSTMYSLFF